MNEMYTESSTSLINDWRGIASTIQRHRRPATAIAKQARRCRHLFNGSLFTSTTAVAATAQIDEVGI